MKFIRRVGKLSPWAVAVAMAFEVGQPALAQPPKPIGTARVASMPLEVGDSAVNVQIAWLSDPALFACNLIARDTPEGIELVGYVPNESVRQKALHIAKTVCGEKVVNHLRIQPGMAIGLTKPATPAELAPTASTLLAEALGEKVMGLRIVSPVNGRVDISGSVPSAEDKLLVSKTLKKLSGCTHVVNQVSATGSSESAATVKNVPMMKSMPTMPPEVPAKATMMSSESFTKSIVPPAVVRTERNHIVPPPAKAIMPPKVAPVAVVTAHASDMPLEAPIKEAPMELPAPKPGTASVSDVPSDAIPKTTGPIVVVPPPKPVAPEVRMVAKEEPHKSTPPSGFNPLKSRPIDTAKATVIDVPKAETPTPEWPKPEASVATESSKGSYYGPGLPKPAPALESTNPAELTIDPPKPVEDDMPKVLDLSPAAPRPSMDRPKTIVLIPEKPKAVEMPKEPTSTAIANPNAGRSSVSDLTSADLAKETPKPVVMPEETKPTAKSDRFVPQVPTTPAATTVNYTTTAPTSLPPIKEADSLKASDNTIKGVIRQNAAAKTALDSNTVRKAIEDICRGSAENVSVRETAGRQLTVGMNCATQGEWDRLYAKIKNLPEVSGYSVIYNVSIDSAAKSSASSSAPMMGIIRTSATSAPAEADAVKKAIENVCLGRGDEIDVRTTGKQQVKVSMKVRSGADWELLYRKIKDLPEVGGYAVIYNVSLK